MFKTDLTSVYLLKVCFQMVPVMVCRFLVVVFGGVFWRSTFVGSAWSFGFSPPPQRPMTSDFKGFSIPDCIHYIYFPILILEKEPVFPF